MLPVPSLLFLLFLLAAAAAKLPEGFQLFSGQDDLVGLTQSDMSELCGTEGILCDSSGGIVSVNATNFAYEIRGFSELLFMPRLKTLVVKDKGYVGFFPTEICTLEHLQSLDLSGNELLGEIPQCVCNMAYLRYINLNDNRLQGTVPKCINGMTVLEELNLRCNVMEEPLPETLKYIKTLVSVDYSCNDYKEYQSDVMAKIYKFGDVDCSSCVQHSSTCPSVLYKYGAGTYVREARP